MSKKRRGCRFKAILLILLILAAWWAYSNRDAIIGIVFPRDYEETVDSYCQLYDMDKWLVLALIREESGFDPNAVSPVGAIGLMQLMPDTAEWLVNTGGFSFTYQEAMTDADKNICLGVYYLSLLGDIYDGKYALMIAAYNAGIGSVDKWLEEGVWDGSLSGAENIPYGETGRHVKNVMRSRDVYLRLYGE